VTYRQIDRQTHRQTTLYSVCSSRPHLAIATMWPNNTYTATVLLYIVIVIIHDVDVDEAYVPQRQRTKRKVSVNKNVGLISKYQIATTLYEVEVFVGFRQEFSTQGKNGKKSEIIRHALAFL